jgi:hypothetical protein
LHGKKSGIAEGSIGADLFAVRITRDPFPEVNEHPLSPARSHRHPRSLIQEVNANNQSAPTSHYDENKAYNITPATNARRLQNLQKQATALNMKLVPA